MPGRKRRIIDADKFLKKSGFKMPSKKTLKEQEEIYAALHKPCVICGHFHRSVL